MSIQRTKPPSYYSTGSAGQWLRLAIAAVDETAAALCRRQWQLAPVRVEARESRALAGGSARHRFGQPADRCGSWH